MWIDAEVATISLPPGPARDTVLALTYGVVVLSVLVQGLTVARVARGVREAPSGR